MKGPWCLGEEVAALEGASREAQIPVRGRCAAHHPSHCAACARALQVAAYKTVGDNLKGLELVRMGPPDIVGESALMHDRARQSVADQVLSWITHS